MRDLFTEIIDELDGIAEDINPTPPEENTRTITQEETPVEKKTSRRK